jgi:hypothetical protein
MNTSPNKKQPQRAKHDTKQHRAHGQKQHFVQYAFKEIQANYNIFGGNCNKHLIIQGHHLLPA